MLTKIATIGAILAFITCAFVQPSGENFKAIAEDARSEAMLRGMDMNPADIRKAADLLSVVASNEHVQAAVKDVAGKKADVSKLTAAVDVLRTVAPTPKKILSTAKSISAKPAQRRTSAAWKTAKKSEDPALSAQLERIEWATRKEDVRLCRDVLTSDTPGGTKGDYLALCIARVTRTAKRCLQIDEAEAPFVRHLCDEELAT